MEILTGDVECYPLVMQALFRKLQYIYNNINRHRNKSKDVLFADTVRTKYFVIQKNLKIV